jgi:glutamine synthetase
MAKPMQGLPGATGHIHFSLTANEGADLFSQETFDAAAELKDVEYLSSTVRDKCPLSGGVL